MYILALYKKCFALSILNKVFLSVSLARFMKYSILFYSFKVLEVAFGFQSIVVAGVVALNTLSV